MELEASKDIVAEKDTEINLCKISSEILKIKNIKLSKEKEVLQKIGDKKD